MEDIAIIGFGLRFPGKANTPEGLWEVMAGGESQWSEFPEDRLNIDGYFHPSGNRQGSVSASLSAVFASYGCLMQSIDFIPWRPFPQGRRVAL